MAAVPLSILDDGGGGEGGDAEGTGDAEAGAGEPPPPPLRPSHHMYYADRIVDVPDRLPKYVKSAGGQATLWTAD